MIVVVNGNPRPGSRTGKLAEAVGRGLAERQGEAEPHLVDLAALGYRLLVPGDVARKISQTAIESATVLVVATPTYKGTYTGILKVMFDALPHNALAGKTAIPLVTAGTDTQATLAAGRLVELLTELGADVHLPALTAAETGLADIDELAASWTTAVAV